MTTKPHNPRLETLRQRLAIIERDGGPCGMPTGLHGCPAGGWPETQQAIGQLVDYLPLRSERDYSVHDLIAALYTIDHADRYRWREAEGGAR